MLNKSVTYVTLGYLLRCTNVTEGFVSPRTNKNGPDCCIGPILFQILQRIQRTNLFRQFSDAFGQPRHFAGARIFMNRALGDAPHDLGLGRL